jgi:glycosyltransferase involved in cell wall biosynthesis
MGDTAHIRPLRIAIDLTHLLEGGKNGGVKPFIFAYVEWLGKQRLVPLTLIFLTRQRSHADVRPLARFGDELICVVEDPGRGEIRTTSHSPSERAWFGAPPDLVARLRADLLYCPFGECSWSFPGVPTLATIVDVLHRDYPFSLPPDLVPHRETLIQHTLRTADSIQGISEFTLSRLVHHYGFPKDRMFCSPIAIHGRLAPQTRTEGEDRGGRPYFLYPANAWEHKNHKGLFLAYGIYRNRAGEGAWDLVLTGHEDEAMRATLGVAASLGLGGSVRFLGHLSEDRFATVWNGAGALVFPSLYEGFGIPLVEAMAFGLPVLASRAGALPEVGGDACLFADATRPIDLADGLVRIAGDPGLRARLREKGYERIRTFSFERDARRFLDELVSCARRPARRTTKGFHVDGWTDPTAYFATPRMEPATARLEVAVEAMPAPRLLKLYNGPDLIGQARLPAGSPTRLDFPFSPRGCALALGVPDATRLAEADHRTHGVRLASLRLRAGTTESNLLAP